MSAGGHAGRGLKGGAQLNALIVMGRCFFCPGLLIWAFSGCSGQQSALDPAGKGAREIADLFWWMTGGAVLVWLIVVGIAFYAIRVKPGPHDPRKTKLLIIGGGVCFPTVVLTVLLSYGLAMIPGIVAPAPEGSLRVHVSGEQWWWRVSYTTAAGERVELANEIRVPVNQPVEFLLDSPDVIHSFWIPALGPKMDMLPGRTNRITLHPERTGVFRGVCAEFCGTSHTFMAFDVVVMEEEEFNDWLERQARPARAAPAGSLASQGSTFFMQNGCAACHTVRGTPARGRIGPDLTHVGSRLTVGAGMLENTEESLGRFIRDADHLKPDVNMPHFRMLPDEEVKALAAYLSSLK